MGSKFSRLGTRVQPKPKVCKSPKTPRPAPPATLHVLLTTNPGTFFFPTTYTCNPIELQLTKGSGDEYSASVAGTGGSTWNFLFDIPPAGGSITGTVVALTPSGTTTGHSVGLTWSGLPPAFTDGTWTRDSGGSLTGDVHLDFNLV